MLVVDAIVVLGVAGLIIYGMLALVLRPSQPAPVASRADGRWETAHYEVDHTTRIVVRLVLPDGTVLDEHVVATVAQDDSEYDAAFLEAMARARQRVALFESEE